MLSRAAGQQGATIAGSTNSWLTAASTWGRSKVTWISIASYGLGLFLALLLYGEVKGSDLAALAGAMIGAGASVLGALAVFDHQRRMVRQQSIDAIGDALVALHAALEPFASRLPTPPHQLIMYGEQALAVRRIAIVEQLNERVLDRGIDVGARFLLRLLEIRARMADVDWRKTDVLVQFSEDGVETYRIGSEQKLTVAQQLRSEVSEALKVIDRLPPIVGRATVLDDSDTVVATAE